MTISSWCVSGKSMFSFADEDSVTCLVNTVIMPLPTLLFASLFLHRLRQIKPFRTFPQLDDITKRHYQILCLCCVSLLILIPLYNIVEMPLSGSIIFSVVLQDLGFLLAIVLTTKECYRITHWPGTSIKLFFCLSLLTLVGNATAYSTHLTSIAAIVLVSAQFIILVIANLVAWLKDYLLSAEELSKLELDRVCVLDYDYEDHFYKQQIQQQQQQQQQMRNSSWSFSGLSLKGWSPFKNSGNPLDVESIEPLVGGATDADSNTNRSSNSFSRASFSQGLAGGGSFSFNGSPVKSGSITGRESFSGGNVYESQASSGTLSAIERSNSELHKTIDNKPVRSFFSRAFGSKQSSADDDSQLIRPQKNWRSASHSEVPFEQPQHQQHSQFHPSQDQQQRSYSVDPSLVGANATGDVSKGKALQRVLKQQKAKNEAADPGLAPRGVLLDTTNDRKGTKGNSLTGRKSETQQHGEYWQVTIGRWAIRKSKTLAVDTNSSGKSIAMVEHSSNATTTAAAAAAAATSPTATAASSGNANNGNSSNTAAAATTDRVFSGLEGEVEYEICIQEVHAWLWNTASSSSSAAAAAAALSSSSRVAQSHGGSFSTVSAHNNSSGADASFVGGITNNHSNSNSNSSSSSGAIAGGAGSSSAASVGSGGLARGQLARKWIVWRTAAEVFILHSQLLSVFGDLSPRKPHLRTAIKSTSTYSLLQSDITNDMRAIAVYITALLRSTQYLSLLQVRSFVNLEADSLPPTLHTIIIGKQSSSAVGAGLGNDESISILSPSALMSAMDANGNPLGSIEDDINADENGNNNNNTNNNNNNEFSVNNNSNIIDMRQSLLGNNPMNDYNYYDDSNNNGNALSSSTAVVSGSMQSAMRNKDSSEQGKWRKVFMNMRMKIKPHEIPIRTRLFVGVISGAEISSWLMKYYCSDLVAAALEGSDQSSNDAFKHAQDRGEACAIGQELINCGLLVPICMPKDRASKANGANNASGANNGSSNLNDDDDDEFAELLQQQQQQSAASSSASASAAMDARSSMVATRESVLGGFDRDRDTITLSFSDFPGFLYRFPAKSATAGGIGTFTIFGSPVSVSIPEWAALDESEAVGRETTVLTIGSKRPSLLSAMGGSTGTVEYLVNVRHADEEWQIWKRFRDFKEFSKQLLKEGIRVEVSFPSTFGGLGGPSLYEARKVKLEQYMNAALEAVVQSGSTVALQATAVFLDDEFDDLQIL